MFSVMEIHVRFKCSQCSKVVETTTARRVVSKTIRVEDQKRRNYLKSDYEVVHDLEDGVYCEYCGYVGGEEDFQKVEEEVKTEAEEVVFDKGTHYRNWLDWIKHIKDLVSKEYGEIPDERKSPPKDS